MTKIKIVADVNHDRVLDVVGASLESRGFTWTPDGQHEAHASEGDAAVGGAALPTSRRLRVRVRIQPDKNRVVLDQKTTGAAMTGAMVSAGAGPWLMIQLGRRSRRVADAVRQDLSAARLHA